MAKYYGEIGYAETIETEEGVWTERINTKKYYGDVLSVRSMYQSTENLNDNINIRNKIAIISDPYANENFMHIRYIVWMGTKWKVTEVEVNYPRLILSIGGVYNDDEQGAETTTP